MKATLHRARARKALLATAAGVMLGCALPAAAQTPKDGRVPGQPTQQQPSQQQPNQQPWSIACAGRGNSADLVCSASQTLVAKNTGQRALAVSISRSQQSAGSYVARFSLPHGVSLPDGIEVGIDQSPRTKHVIGVADQNGSYAVVPLDEARIAAMKRGSILNVRIKGATGDEVILQLSLAGFTAALAKL
jgi:invasion protein IalB